MRLCVAVNLRWFWDGEKSKMAQFQRRLGSSSAGYWCVFHIQSTLWSNPVVGCCFPDLRLGEVFFTANFRQATWKGLEVFLCSNMRPQWWFPCPSNRIKSVSQTLSTDWVDEVDGCWELETCVFCSQCGSHGSIFSWPRKEHGTPETAAYVNQCSALGYGIATRAKPVQNWLQLREQLHQDWGG